MIFLTVDKIDIENACIRMKNILEALKSTDEIRKKVKNDAIEVVNSIIDAVNITDDFGYDVIYKLEAYTQTLELICGRFLWNSWLSPTESDTFRINLFLINQVIDKLKRIHLDQYATCVKLDDILYELKEIKKKLK